MASRRNQPELFAGANHFGGGDGGGLQRCGRRKAGLDVEQQLDQLREQDTRTLGLVEELSKQVAGAVGVKRAG